MMASKLAFEVKISPPHPSSNTAICPPSPGQHIQNELHLPSTLALPVISVTVNCNVILLVIHT